MQSDSATPASSPTFAQLGVAIEIVEALEQAGISRTFAIQELTLPIALGGFDLIGQARTGMGKTYGFGVPLLDRVFDDADIAELDGSPRALIVVPTRELAVQVGEDLTAAASRIPVSVTTVYGGRPYEEQLAALTSGADVVVGTPGRLIDLMDSGSLDLSGVAILVLDEADEMLDLGFLPDIEKLMAVLDPKKRGVKLQTMLFSATMPGPIMKLARTFLHKPVHIRAESGEDSFSHEGIEKIVFQAHKMDKDSILARALQADGRGRTIIFTRTKRSAATVASDLAQRGFRVAAVHGDLGQAAREKSLGAFRDGSVDILVATDVAARGIDINDVTHVFNYQVPDDPMTFVHRIGRTGRAGNTGTAVTLVGFDELHKWQVINTELGLSQPEPPQWFSTSPELAKALNIPSGVTETVGPAAKVVGEERANATRSNSRAPGRKRRAGADSGANSGADSGADRAQRAHKATRARSRRR